MRVSVIGLGRMGHAVAERLSGCHELTVWNRTSSKAEDLGRDGVTIAPDPAAAVAGAEAVITSLSDDAALSDLLFGGGGLTAVLPDDALYADASTISPSLSSEIEAKLRNYVSLPILGAPQAVTAGQAIYLAGGQERLLGRLEPILDTLGGKVQRFQRAPQACAAKLAVNLLLLSGIVTLAEAITVGRAGGLQDEELKELLCATPMLAPGLENRLDGVFAGTAETWWPPPLAAKDAGLAVELAGSRGTTLRVGHVVQAAYESAIEMGLSDDDMVAVARIYG